ncbi:MAG TPA: DUF2723 domain-containing protein [Chloroflexia bacterium]|nr:DUF2723 domain-containing protein [Chloroflexia bacterium]
MSLSPVASRGAAYSTSDRAPAGENTPSRDFAPIALGAAIVLVAAALYVRTLAPSVMPGDYAEFQMCAAVLGVPHPTGYPLYVLLGKLFTLLPVGDVAYRVNLSSAVYMAAAAGLLYALGARLLRLAGLRDVWWASAVSASLFVVAPTVWSMSLVARSYALNALLVGAVVSCLVLWRQRQSTRWFYLSCLLIGLSMVHHGTTYLLLPSYALYLLVIEVELRKAGMEARPIGRWAKGVLSLLAGLSPMLFLVYRFLGGSPYYWGNPTTWKDFFNLLTGGPFHNQVMGFGWNSQLERVAFGIGELSGQYTPVGIGLGLLGLAVLWRASRPEALLLVLMLVGNFLFAMNYSLVGYLYFIPTYLVWGLFMCVGAGWLLHGTRRLLVGRYTSPTIRIAGVAAGLIFGLVVLYIGALRLPGIDQSGQTGVRDEALALLSSAPKNASLYLDWEDLSVVRFYRMVYGMRPDVTLHSGDPATWAKLVYCDAGAGITSFVGEFAGAIPPVIQRDFELAEAPMGRRVVSVKNSRRYEIPPCGTCATCR